MSAFFFFTFLFHLYSSAPSSPSSSSALFHTLHSISFQLFPSVVSFMGFFKLLSINSKKKKQHSSEDWNVCLQPGSKYENNKISPERNWWEKTESGDRNWKKWTKPSTMLQYTVKQPKTHMCVFLCVCVRLETLLSSILYCAIEWREKGKKKVW